MMPKILTFFFGFCFAAGLGVSQMTRPQKILAFLDLAGSWDPSLLLVMAGAVGIYFPIQSYLRKLPRPRYEECFVLPKTKAIDPSLIIGAAIFGIGWGIVGFCPGPAVVSLASLKPEVAVFVLGLGIGMFCQNRFQQKKQKTPQNPARPKE